MLIGVRAHDFGRYSPTELAGKVKAAGFEAVQLAIHKAILGVDNFSQITPKILQDIRAAFEQKDIELTVLGCYIEPSLLDKEARMQQLDIFFKAIEYSKVIGAKLVGTETTTFIEDENERKKYFEILVDSVLRMTEKAEKVGANIAIEPVSVHTLNTPELTYTLLQRVKSDKLKIIFDPVNMLTMDKIHKQDELWKECFEAFGQSIEVVHAKDIIVENNIITPVVLGKGIVEYDYLLSWIGKNKPYINILREEAVPETTHEDIAFLKNKIKIFMK